VRARLDRLIAKVKAAEDVSPSDPFRRRVAILVADGPKGDSIAMRVCMVIKLGANGLISRIDEYFDPAELAPLLT
jgi:hypothetical protein